jgi:hypothetical protein
MLGRALLRLLLCLTLDCGLRWLLSLTLDRTLRCLLCMRD